MTYDEIAIYRKLGDAALASATDLDRQIRGVVDIDASSIEAFLVFFSEFSAKAPDGVPHGQNRAFLEVVSQLLGADSSQKLKTVDDLRNEIDAFVSRARLAVVSGADSGLRDLMADCLKVHDTCLASSAQIDFGSEELQL